MTSSLRYSARQTSNVRLTFYEHGCSSSALPSVHHFSAISSIVHLQTALFHSYTRSHTWRRSWRSQIWIRQTGSYRPISNISVVYKLLERLSSLVWCPSWRPLVWRRHCSQLTDSATRP